MILDAAGKWSISLTSSFVIGDRAGDLEAARRSGCKSVFIDRGYVADPIPLMYDYKAVDVLDAVMWCIAQGGAVQNAESF
jgi:histidinol phosphatase-like enzyme